MRKGFFI